MGPTFRSGPTHARPTPTMSSGDEPRTAEGRLRRGETERSVSNPPDHDPVGPPGSAPAPGWQGHHETPPGWPGRRETPPGRPFPAGLLARYTRRGTDPGQLPPPGRGTGRLALALGALALITSVFVIGGVVGVAAIVVGMRARAHARRNRGGGVRSSGGSRGGDAAGAGGGTGTVGLALGALSLLIAFTVASGMWVFYDRHGDDLHDYQECRRGARSAQELDDCSRRFNDAVRTDPTSNG